MRSNAHERDSNSTGRASTVPPRRNLWGVMWNALSSLQDTPTLRRRTKKRITGKQVPSWSRSFPTSKRLENHWSARTYNLQMLDLNEIRDLKSSRNSWILHNGTNLVLPKSMAPKYPSQGDDGTTLRPAEGNGGTGTHCAPKKCCTEMPCLQWAGLYSAASLSLCSANHSQHARTPEGRNRTSQRFNLTFQLSHPVWNTTADRRPQLQRSADPESKHASSAPSKSPAIQCQPHWSMLLQVMTIEHVEQKQSI